MKHISCPVQAQPKLVLLPEGFVTALGISVCSASGKQCQQPAGSSAPGGLQGFRRTNSVTASVLPEQDLGILSALLDFALSSFASLFGHIPVQNLEIGSQMNK